MKISSKFLQAYSTLSVTNQEAQIVDWVLLETSKIAQLLKQSQKDNKILQPIHKRKSKIIWIPKMEMEI
jgi:hypothetical protein